MGSTIRSTGDRIDNHNLKPCFVQGAYNLGAVIVSRELETTAVHPGEGIDPGAAAGGGEDNYIEMANASVLCLGIAELDLGMIAGASSDYALGDEIPGLLFHWNLGALVRNVQLVDPAAAIEPGRLLGTTSGTAGSFKDDATTLVCMRAAKYAADAGAAQLTVAWFGSV